jgi:hypothetical protein
LLAKDMPLPDAGAVLGTVRAIEGASDLFRSGSSSAGLQGDFSVLTVTVAMIVIGID